jgi:molecular chaperone IbpA
MTGYDSLFPRSAFVGFDHLFDELDRAVKQANDHYPPHNIVKSGENDYLIELAVAGFAKDDLTVEVKDRSLMISGEHKNRGREYIHRGISTKKFNRTFRLSEYVKVSGAELIDGVLSVHLKVVVPEEMRPRVIPIGTNEASNEPTKPYTQQFLAESTS